MMRKLDQRGVAALEFCLVAVPLFTLMFVIFDLGRYAITMQSLHALANAGARAVMINCYTPDVSQATVTLQLYRYYLSATRRSKLWPRSCMAAASRRQLNTAAGAAA